MNAKTPNFSENSSKNDGKSSKNVKFNDKNKDNERLDNIFYRKKFKSLIKKKKTSISYLAKRIGIHRSTIHRWINGDLVPNAAEYAMLCIILRVDSFNELIDIKKLQNLCNSNFDIFSAQTDPTISAVPKDLDFYAALDPRPNPDPDFYPSQINTHNPNNALPLTNTRSAIESTFPRINNIAAPVELTKHPRMAEKYHGYSVTFEETLDRYYRRKWYAASPANYDSPDEAPPSHSLICPNGALDAWGDDIYVFVDDDETIYPWKSWNILRGVAVFSEALSNGHPATTKWFKKMSVDDARGWFQDMYNLDESNKTENFYVEELSEEDLNLNLQQFNPPSESDKPAQSGAEPVGDEDDEDFGITPANERNI